MGASASPLGEYLRARRKLLKPEDVGLPSDAARRVPGLRREEVAARADISPEYYLRIEQGRDRRPSEQVVRSLAKALLLDDDGANYLFRMARPLPYLRTVREPSVVSPSVQRLLDQWTQTPAYVTDANLDVLAANRLARLVSPGILVPGTNLLEATYEHLTMATMTTAITGADVALEWEDAIREYIGALRFNGDPDDARLQDVVGRLSSRHLSFRRIWAEHDVNQLTTGLRQVSVEPFGRLDLIWQTLGIPRSPRQFLTTYMAEPGSRSADALSALSGGLESTLVLGGRDRESGDERAS